MIDIGTVLRESRDASKTVRSLTGFRSSECALLVALNPDHAMPMSQLADQIGLSPAGTTRLVGRLEARGGWVSRKQYKGDARVVLARLTEAGRGEAIRVVRLLETKMDWRGY